MRKTFVYNSPHVFLEKVSLEKRSNPVSQTVEKSVKLYKIECHNIKKTKHV